MAAGGHGRRGIELICRRPGPGALGRLSCGNNRSSVIHYSKSNGTRLIEDAHEAAALAFSSFFFFLLLPCRMQAQRSSSRARGPQAAVARRTVGHCRAAQRLTGLALPLSRTSRPSRRFVSALRRDRMIPPDVRSALPSVTTRVFLRVALGPACANRGRRHRQHQHEPPSRLLLLLLALGRFFLTGGPITASAHGPAGVPPCQQTLHASQHLG